MSRSNRTPTHGDYPNYAANHAFSASESLLREVRRYLADQQGAIDLVATVEAALAALEECRGSLRQGYDVRPAPGVLSAIDQAIDAVMLVNIRTNAQVDVGTEAQLVEVRRARETAESAPTK